MGKVSEAQKRASRKWDKKNKEKKNYIVVKANAKRFINKFATASDLDNLEKLISERRKEL